MSLYNIYNPVPTIFTLSHFFGGPDIYLPPRQKKGTTCGLFPRSLKTLVAESEGFEPPDPRRVNGFRDRPDRPLRQLSLVMCNHDISRLRVQN